MCISLTTASKYMWQIFFFMLQKLMELQGEIDESTSRGGDFNEEYFQQAHN